MAFIDEDQAQVMPSAAKPRWNFSSVPGAHNRSVSVENSLVMGSLCVLPTTDRVAHPLLDMRRTDVRKSVIFAV